MREETRTCQNCKTDFRIEPEDFAFYEKIKVPPPTFCPECRLQRRLMFRNERHLYRRACDLCGKSIITAYSPDKPFKVYCNPCWWSDKWDAGQYAMEYDPKRNFFEQLRELQRTVPFMALLTEYPTLINSEYVSHTGNAKNCYFIFNADYAENCAYLTNIVNTKECMDGYAVHFTERAYEAINVEKSYNIFFSEDIESSNDIYFSKNLSGCSNCFGCINLRSKHYYIFNEKCDPEEYKKKLGELKLGSHASIAVLRTRAYEFWNRFPRKFLHGVHNINSSGDYIYNCKNVKESYLVTDGEDLKFCQSIKMKPAKDAYDYTEWGNGAERVYECITIGQGASDIRMCFAVWDHVFEVEYSMYIVSSSHMFGCIGIRKKEYCILNKQYTKEEYEVVHDKIVQEMNEHPYADAKGRVFRYGELFPYELSPFDYNESSAQDYFLLAKEAVAERGWRWKEKENSTHQITKRADELPDHIQDVDDEIVKEIIGCAECGRAYRIIPQELDLLRSFGLPVPRKCFECRYAARLSRMNLMRFYERICAKCGVGIKTSYAPNRPEIIYCETCFQNEVV